MARANTNCGPMYRWGILRWKGTRIPAKFNFAEEICKCGLQPCSRNECSGFRGATQMARKRLNLRKSPEKISWELRSKASFEALHCGKIWVLPHCAGGPKLQDEKSEAGGYRVTPRWARITQGSGALLDMDGSETHPDPSKCTQHTSCYFSDTSFSTSSE